MGSKWKSKTGFLKNVVYRQMCELRRCRDKAHFDIFLGAFLETLTHFPTFEEYFKSYYLPEERMKKWALHERPSDICDTTSHVETYHRLLKYVAMGGKSSRICAKVLSNYVNRGTSN